MIRVYSKLLKKFFDPGSIKIITTDDGIEIHKKYRFFGQNSVFWVPLPKDSYLLFNDEVMTKEQFKKMQCK